MSIHLIIQKGGKIMFLKHNVKVYKKEEKILIGKTCINGFYGVDKSKGKIQARLLLVERNKKLVVVQKIGPSKYRKHERVVQENIGNKSREKIQKAKIGECRILFPCKVIEDTVLRAKNKGKKAA
ncbi:hypothetical protein WN48_07845 [Eufriesea mexicana]|nr:hypothetical protein WN48_07845 [Eufriesea mexicana]